MMTDFEFDALPRRIESLSEVEACYREGYEPDPTGGWCWTRDAERLHATYAHQFRELTATHAAELQKADARIAARERRIIDGEITNALCAAGVDSRDAPLVAALIRRDTRFTTELRGEDIEVRAAPEHGAADLDFTIASFLASDAGRPYAPRPQTPAEGPLLRQLRAMRDEGAH